MEKVKNILVPKVIIPVAVVLALLVAYFVGFVYFSTRFLPGTIINGRNYGGKTLQYAENDIQRPLVTEITLVGKENTQETLNLAKADCREEVSIDDLKAIKNEQSSFLWFTGLFGEKEHELSFEMMYDDAALSSLIDGLDMVCGRDIVSPQNADIVLGMSDYEIIPEVVGNTLDTAILKSNIVESMTANNSEINLEDMGTYVVPDITENSPEIEKVKEKVDPIMSMVLTFDFSDRKEVLDYSTISDWVTFNKDTGLTIDEKKAKKFVLSLAEKYDTLHTVRQFRTSYGTDISIGGGIYGWQINLNETTSALIEHIMQGETKTVVPIYTTYGLERGVNDIGNTYVEIDLTKQHMWFYKNGQLLVDTGVVTGLPGTWRETPTGVFSVWSKETKRYLSGEDYKLWVEYWMPIDWKGVGIHDATWQPTFGGDAYLYRGSHGCINTPRDLCAIIFNNIEVATPVIIYKS